MAVASGSGGLAWERSIGWWVERIRMWVLRKLAAVRWLGSKRRIMAVEWRAALYVSGSGEKRWVKNLCLAIR